MSAVIPNRGEPSKVPIRLVTSEKFSEKVGAKLVNDQKLAKLIGKQFRRPLLISEWLTVRTRLLGKPREGFIPKAFANKLKQ